MASIGFHERGEAIDGADSGLEQTVHVSAVATNGGGTPRLGPNAAILGSTMGEYPDFRTPDREQSHRSTDETEPLLSQQGQQELAHERGRICKKRGCVVCAPMVEQRRLKKKQRKAEAQAALHAKGKPCGRSSCSLAVCVEARDVAAASSPPVEPRPGDRRNDHPREDADRKFRREVERHRAGLPCGSEDCPNQMCIDGFANERTRKHRAGRPCRSTTCDIAICVSGRSTN